jgi:drug/metabolite transporter (DMT)-like permease
MAAIILLVTVTVLYAGYNLCIKISGTHIPDTATTTILATLLLQTAALITSSLFYSYLAVTGGYTFTLTNSAYLWAILAGICIGAAEIGYLYLFGGVGLSKPMDASVAIPSIVAGTIVIALLFSVFFLKESLAWNQVIGSALILCGIAVFFFRQSVAP